MHAQGTQEGYRRERETTRKKEGDKEEEKERERPFLWLVPFL
jgi:hypothetical protein